MWGSRQKWNLGMSQILKINNIYFMRTPGLLCLCVASSKWNKLCIFLLSSIVWPPTFFFSFFLPLIQIPALQLTCWPLSWNSQTFKDLVEPQWCAWLPPPPPQKKSCIVCHAVYKFKYVYIFLTSLNRLVKTWIKILRPCQKLPFIEIQVV